MDLKNTKLVKSFRDDDGDWHEFFKNAKNVFYTYDNCKDDYNPAQEDMDHDGIGDFCEEDEDFDHDGVMNIHDNCIFVSNPDQSSTGISPLGDACKRSRSR